MILMMRAERYCKKKTILKQHSWLLAKGFGPGIRHLDGETSHSWIINRLEYRRLA